jgi:hypothetical protein
MPFPALKDRATLRAPLRGDGGGAAGESIGWCGEGAARVEGIICYGEER